MKNLENDNCAKNFVSLKLQNIQSLLKFILKFVS